MTRSMHRLFAHRHRQCILIACLLGGLLWVMAKVPPSALAQEVADAGNCPACAQIKASLDEARRADDLITAEREKAIGRRDVLKAQRSLAEIERRELASLDELVKNLNVRSLEQINKIILIQKQWSECVARSCPNLKPWGTPPPAQSTCSQCKELAEALARTQGNILVFRVKIAHEEAAIEKNFSRKLMADEMTKPDQLQYQEAQDRLNELRTDLESALRDQTLKSAELGACSRQYCAAPTPMHESQAICVACQSFIERIDTLVAALQTARNNLAELDRQMIPYEKLGYSGRSNAEEAALKRLREESNKARGRVKQLEGRILALSAELETCVKEQCRPRTTPRVIIEQVIPRIGNAPFTPVRPGPTAVVPLPPQTPATPTPTPTPPPVATPQPTPPTPPVTPPAPPPTPQTGCASDFSSGNYICSGSCGIGSVNLSVTPGSSTMTANTLGANSAVVFSCSGSTASSQSSNLIILGAPGHRCNQIASGLSSFTESCSNAGGGTCSSTCSR